tara:strand:+ start:323 stop:667 length:345 start_codon:yes stop_codon:yes gene_type:complete
MRVKIAYSVDLDEVPGRVQKNIEDALRLLELVDENLLQSNRKLAERNTMGCLENLEEAHTLISKLLESAADCGSIVRGYQATVLQMKEQEIAAAQAIAQAQAQTDPEGVGDAQP